MTDILTPAEVAEIKARHDRRKFPCFSRADREGSFETQYKAIAALLASHEALRAENSILRDGWDNRAADLRTQLDAANAEREHWHKRAEERTEQLHAANAEIERLREGWEPAATVPKSGEYLLCVWEGDWNEVKKRCRVYHATGHKDGPSWAMMGSYRLEEGGAYKIAGWMPLPEPPK